MLTIDEAQAAFEKVAVIETAARKKFNEITTERNTQVKALEKQRWDLQAQIAQLYQDYRDPVIAASDELDVALKAQDKAFTELNRAFFEEAQARIDTEVSPAELVAGIDAAMNSKHQWDPKVGSMGVHVVIRICDQQHWRGFHRGELGRIDCDTYHRRTWITKRQQERIWEYLTQVCPEREDEGLAPPFKIEWNSWRTERKELCPMLKALIPRA